MSRMPKPCHKHAKVHANVCSGKNTYQSQERQIEGTQKETYFPSQRSQLRSSKASTREATKLQTLIYRELPAYGSFAPSPKVTRQNCCTRVPGPSVLKSERSPVSHEFNGPAGKTDASRHWWITSTTARSQEPSSSSRVRFQ